MRKISLPLLVLASALLFFCQGGKYPQGKRLYSQYCANCHMDDGSGLEGLIPPLAESDYTRQNFDKMPCIIRYGMKGEVVVNGRSYDQAMEGIPGLGPVEIANIMNYIADNWVEGAEYVSAKEVEGRLGRCAE